MVLVRKLISATTLLKRHGLTTFGEVARIRARSLYDAHRPVPPEPERRALRLARKLNGSSLVSPVAIDSDDARAVRDALLMAFLRDRHAEVVALADVSAGLSPPETVLLAESLAAVWDFPRIVADAAAWADATTGTKFARRIDQRRRRAALSMGRLREAAENLDTTGDDLGALFLKADVHDARGEMGEASRAYETAMRRDGRDSHVRRSYGFHLMKRGRILDGLASWSAAEGLARIYPLRHHRPQWTGERIGERRLMVLFEHGLGDMIQMSRFLPLLRAREPAAAVIGRVPAPLAGLLRRSFPDVAFVVDTEREPDYDLFVPSMQLPAVLGAETLEPRTRYIELGRDWRAAPKSTGRPRVGICWRGHPRQYELARSIPIEIFQVLFEDPGADFVVLLNSLTAAESTALSRFAQVEAPPITDFVDLAAVIASCDLVVSVDTAVVHLAAAGGAPVILLSRPDACWRWGAAGSEGPWYATVDVLRHDGDIDWPRMLATATERIRERVTSPAVVGAHA